MRNALFKDCFVIIEIDSEKKGNTAMGLYKNCPKPSGRMGALWTLSTIRNAAVLEYGSMGHMVYAYKWLEQTGSQSRSKIYTTHIDETDITFGKTERIEQGIKEVVQKENPEVIFLLPSSVPEMIGIDLEAVCDEIADKYKDITIIPIAAGGFGASCHKGIEMALHTLCKTLPVKIEVTKEPTYNLIGSCSDLYNFKADANEIQRVLAGALHMEPVCILSSDTSINKIRKMGEAHINLVLRYEGLKAAKELENKFGTPYIYQRPYGYDGTVTWLKEIKEKTQGKLQEAFISAELAEGKKAVQFVRQMTAYQPERTQISIGGHGDVVNGILEYALKETGMSKGICWTNDKDRACDQIPYYEDIRVGKEMNHEQTGIIMADYYTLKRIGRSETLKVEKSLNEWELNPYVPPLIGFRGALHLASIWFQNIMEE